MNLEEILVKVGLDGNSLSQGVRKLKTELKELAEHGHAGFVHMGNEGRAFHRLMERISEVSPVAGAALQGAFTPVIGLITLATLALKAFNERLEERRKLEDEQGLRNSRASFDSLEAQSKVHDHVVDAVEEQHKFQRQLAEAHNEQLEKLREQEKLIETQLKLDEKRLEANKELSTYAKNKVELETKAAQQTLKAQEATQKALQAELERAKKLETGYYQQYRSDPTYKASVSATGLATSTKAEMDRLTERGNDLRNMIGSLGNSKLALGADWLNAHLFTGKETRGELEEEERENSEKLEALKKVYEKQREAAQELTDRLKVQKSQWDESKEQTQRLSNASYELSQKILDTKNRLALASFQVNPLRPFLPGLSDFAETRGPIGNLARQVLGTREGISNELLRGNTKGAEFLRRRLQGFDVQGFDMPDWSQGGKLVPTKTHVKGLEERWAEVLRTIVGENGVPVQITQVAD